MQKKVIFFDVDGTLTDGSVGISTPTVKTKEIIQKMIKLGHIPVLATGRPYCMINEHIKGLGFTSFICSAGAYVLLEGNPIAKNQIPAHLIQKIINLAIEYDVAIYTEDENYIYVHPKHEKTMYGFLVGNNLITENQLIITDNFLDKINYKLFIRWTDRKNFEKLQDAVKEDFKFAIFRDKENDGGADVMHINQSKAVGIETILKAMNLTKKDAYAVGDGHNDIEMFELVGNSIAMGNGVDELKAIATIVTDSVEDDGIYNAFIKMDWMQ